MLRWGGGVHAPWTLEIVHDLLPHHVDNEPCASNLATPLTARKGAVQHSSTRFSSLLLLLLTVLFKPLPTDKMADFNFDLAEPLQTHRTNHQRNFSRSLLSNIKFEPRTLEQREADAKRNAPKYAREKAVNSMLTARFAKAKKTFDTYYGYNIDEAFDGDNGTWRDDRDPWLRIAQAPTVATEGEEHAATSTMEEFLRGYTKGRVEAQKAGVDPDVLTGEELEALATGVLRVAKVDLAAAGRDNSMVDNGFKTRALEVVGQLKTEYELPQTAPEVEVEEEEEEDEAEKVNEVNGVNGA